MILKTNRLEIEVLEPGTEYKRSRFDWGAIVKQILLDGTYTFCSQEASAVGKGTEGIGLSCEFGIHTAVGYDECIPGEWFPKIGIGKLKKEDNSPYDFFSDYEIKPIPYTVKQNQESSVVFTQQCEDINGYGWKLSRTIVLEENTLSLKNELTNTGNKLIETEEYCHNFLQLDKKEVGPEYNVTLSENEQFIKIIDITVNGNQLSPSKKTDTYFYGKAAPYTQQTPKTWTLSCSQTPAKVSVTENFPAVEFAVWGMSHVISPEVFKQISLAPNQSENWERKYTFTS